MNDQQKSSESGQAIVLLVLAMIVLLGFTALAIDGSMVYSDRRWAQNAADASSLAGGGRAALEMENRNITYKDWPCNTTRTSTITDADLAAVASLARTAAVNRADDNDFTIANGDISTRHGVITECGAETIGPFVDRFLDITTNITADTDTAFAHFVYKGIMRNSVEAITRVRPRAPLAYGQAIVALNPADCSGHSNGANFNMSGAQGILNVVGGGVFSNGCMRGSGQPEVNVTGGGNILYKYTTNTPGMDNFSPNPDTHDSVIPPSEYALDPPPDCSHPAAHNLTANQFENAAESGLSPGLYCVSGDVNFHGNTPFSGDGVTIVLLNGSFTYTGAGGNAPQMNFTAPYTADPTPAIRGLLIYAPPENHNDIHLGGNEFSTWTGTILATGMDIEVTGNGNSDAFHTQIIGFNVEFNGSSESDVTWEGGEQSWISARIDLWR